MSEHVYEVQSHNEYEDNYEPPAFPRLRLINLTPHDIVISDLHWRSEPGTCTIPKSGVVARVEQRTEPGNPLHGGVPGGMGGSLTDYVELATGWVTYGEPIGLPAPAPNVYYIVSKMVADAVPHRDDVLFPDTGGDATRDEAGRIISVQRLLRLRTK